VTAAPNVSVVIPTFNRRVLVSKAIESALAQTYRSREVIVVDDGSTDGTGDELRPYREHIRYIYQANRGVSGALNAGIALARAPWIAVLASDDLWLPTKLEAQVAAVERAGTGVGACFTNCEFMGDPARTLSAFEEAGLECGAAVQPLDDPLKWIRARHPALYVQSMLVSRAALDRAGGFDEQLVVGEDTDLLFRLAFQTRFCVVRSTLVRIDRNPWREHGLLELYARRDDPLFECIERRFQKWLRLPEVTDPTLRAEIQDDLVSLYYVWTIARLYDLRFAAALAAIGRLRREGASLPRIALALASRAARRLRTALGPGPVPVTTADSATRSR
jgi:glycosyltransferase involved in cell wall biosynthesis